MLAHYFFVKRRLNQVNKKPQTNAFKADKQDRKYIKKI